MESSALFLPESPVPDLLACNRAASDQEKKVVRSFIEILNNQCTEIDKGTEDLVKAKKAEKEALASVIRQHEAILHPVRDLAPEILDEIFSHCQRGSPALIVPEVPQSFHPLEGPMLLTHVCRQWRSVAIASSSLWTTLRVEYGFPTRSPSQSLLRLPLVKLWLSRSRNAPLDLCFHFSSDYAVQPLDMTETDFFKQLLGCLNRWRSISIISFLPHDVLSTFSPYAKALSVLKNYKFVTPDIVHDGPLRRAQAPHRAYLDPSLVDWPLTTQHISHQSGFHYDGLLFPFHQLTSLAIYSELGACFITIEEFFTILTKGPNLEDLRVRCIGVDMEFPDPHSGNTEKLIDISHPRIHTLHIAVVNDGYLIDPLLQHVSFPSLKNFSIGSTTSKRAWTHAALSHFLDRTSRGIQEIKLVASGIGWSEVAQYFLYTPNAIRVSVAASGLRDYELCQATDYLHRLQHLELKGHVHISSGAFTKFITRRCKPYPRHGDTELALLRSLSICCLEETSAFVDVAVFGMLQQYWEKGTDIKIETDYACLFPRDSFLPRRY